MVDKAPTFRWLREELQFDQDKDEWRIRWTFDGERTTIKVPGYSFKFVADFIAAAPETAAERDWVNADRDRLRAINAELVAALDTALANALVPTWHGLPEISAAPPLWLADARAALAKAREDG